jgi:hypothetical protein
MTWQGFIPKFLAGTRIGARPGACEFYVQQKWGRIWESEVREALLKNAMFFIRLEQLNVTEEEKTSVALGQKMDLVFHRKYFAAWLLLLPGL